MATIQEYIKKLSSEQLVKLLIDDCEGQSNLPCETIILIIKTLEERLPNSPLTEKDWEIYQTVYLKRYPEHFPPSYNS